MRGCTRSAPRGGVPAQARDRQRRHLLLCLTPLLRAVAAAGRSLGDVVPRGVLQMLRLGAVVHPLGRAASAAQAPGQRHAQLTTGWGMGGVREGGGGGGGQGTQGMGRRGSMASAHKTLGGDVPPPSESARVAPWKRDELRSEANCSRPRWKLVPFRPPPRMPRSLAAMWSLASDSSSDVPSDGTRPCSSCPAVLGRRSRWKPLRELGKWAVFPDEPTLSARPPSEQLVVSESSVSAKDGVGETSGRPSPRPWPLRRRRGGPVMSAIPTSSALRCDDLPAGDGPSSARCDDPAATRGSALVDERSVGRILRSELTEPPRARSAGGVLAVDVAGIERIIPACCWLAGGRRACVRSKEKVPGLGRADTVDSFSSPIAEEGDIN